MKKNYKKPTEKIVTTEFHRHILNGGSNKKVNGLSEDTKNDYGLVWDAYGIEDEDM